jgi:hypothetical protein
MPRGIACVTGEALQRWGIKAPGRPLGCEWRLGWDWR